MGIADDGEGPGEVAHDHADPRARDRGVVPGLVGEQDRLPALEPTQTRAVPGRVLSEECGDPIRIIVVVAQGCVA